MGSGTEAGEQRTERTTKGGVRVLTSPRPGFRGSSSQAKKKKSDEQRRETRIFQNIPDGETAWVKAGEPWGEE